MTTPYVPAFQIVFFGISHDVPADNLCKRSDADSVAKAIGGATVDLVPPNSTVFENGTTASLSDATLSKISWWWGIAKNGITVPYIAAKLLAEETPYGAWGKDTNGQDAWIPAPPPPAPIEPPAQNPANTFPGFPGSVKSTAVTLDDLMAYLVRKMGP